MSHEIDGDDTAQDSIPNAQDPGDTAGNAAPDASASPAAQIPGTPPDTAVAPEASTVASQAATQPGNLAELSARLRSEAAEIAEIAAQAGRLGVAIDAANALREGTTPEALRRLVIERASAAADARDIVAAPPSPILPQARESPIIAAAKRAAEAGKRR